MTTATHTHLVEQQVSGLNGGNLDEVVAGYADDATFVLYSPHTLPGSELRLEGKEKISRHMQRVLDGGVEGVTIDWIDGGDGFLAWRDHGSFGNGTAFSEAHTAKVGADGLISEHCIHSVYGRGK